MKDDNAIYRNYSHADAGEDHELRYFRNVSQDGMPMHFDRHNSIPFDDHALRPQCPGPVSWQEAATTGCPPNPSSGHPLRIVTRNEIAPFDGQIMHHPPQLQTFPGVEQPIESGRDFQLYQNAFSVNPSGTAVWRFGQVSPPDDIHPTDYEALSLNTCWPNDETLSMVFGHAMQEHTHDRHLHEQNLQDQHLQNQHLQDQHLHTQHLHTQNLHSQQLHGPYLQEQYPSFPIRHPSHLNMSPTESPISPHTFTHTHDQEFCDDTPFSPPKPVRGRKRSSQVSIMHGPRQQEQQPSFYIPHTPYPGMSPTELSISPQTFTPMHEQDFHVDPPSSLPKQCRGRKRSNRVSNTSPLSEATESDKRDAFLERNRQAATKCRQKKKMRDADTDMKRRFLEMQNGELKLEFEKLRAEFRELRSRAAEVCERVQDGSAEELQQHLLKLARRPPDCSLEDLLKRIRRKSKARVRKRKEKEDGDVVESSEEDEAGGGMDSLEEEEEAEEGQE